MSQINDEQLYIIYFEFFAQLIYCNCVGCVEPTVSGVLVMHPGSRACAGHILPRRPACNGAWESARVASAGHNPLYNRCVALVFVSCFLALWHDPSVRLFWRMLQSI